MLAESRNHQPSEEESPRKKRPLPLIVVPIMTTVALLACIVISFIIWRRKSSKKQGENFAICMTIFSLVVHFQENLTIHKVVLRIEHRYIPFFILNPENRISYQRKKELLKLDTQRRIKHLIDSGGFEEEDEKGIDVPFFDFESILVATDDFSDANKLGQGGYGPVYKVFLANFNN